MTTQAIAAQEHCAVRPQDTHAPAVLAGVETTAACGSARVKSKIHVKEVAAAYLFLVEHLTFAATAVQALRARCVNITAGSRSSWWTLWTS